MTHPDVARFDNEWKGGDRARAKVMAKEYVAAHKGELEPILSKFTIEGLVDLVTAYRNAGREEDRLVTDMWLLSEYEPQNITGQLLVGAEQMKQIVSEAEAIAMGKVG